MESLITPQSLCVQQSLFLFSLPWGAISVTGDRSACPGRSEVIKVLVVLSQHSIWRKRFETGGAVERELLENFPVLEREGEEDWL